MIMLSQNKKIAISAMALFLVSFSLMLFFLENGGSDNTQVNVFQSNSHNQETSTGNTVEQYYRTLINTEDPIFVTNAEGKFIFTSDGFCRLLSAKCDNLAGDSLFNYIDGKDMSNVIAGHTKIIQNGENVKSIGPYRMLKGNDEILVLLDAHPILGKDDEVSEIIFAVKDLTKQVEEMKGKEKPEVQESEKKNWIEEIYPKIKDLQDEELRMMVDKISYKPAE